MKRDYQCVVENFAEGIVVVSDDKKIQFINSNLQAFIEGDDMCKSEFEILRKFEVISEDG